MKMNLIVVVIMVFLVCFQLTSAKEIYKYRYQRDDGGIVTTDRFDNVPEKYRDSVEKIPLIDVEERVRLMKRNAQYGRPLLWGLLNVWPGELEKLIIGKKKEEVLKLLGEPERVSESGKSKIWIYDCDVLYWIVNDPSSKVRVKKVILTLRYLSQDNYEVDDISYSQ